MSRLPRVSGPEVLVALARAGGAVCRWKGSSHQFSPHWEITRAGRSKDRGAGEACGDGDASGDGSAGVARGSAVGAGGLGGAPRLGQDRASQDPERHHERPDHAQPTPVLGFPGGPRRFLARTDSPGSAGNRGQDAPCFHPRPGANPGTASKASSPRPSGTPRGDGKPAVGARDRLGSPRPRSRRVGGRARWASGEGLQEGAQAFPII